MPNSHPAIWSASWMEASLAIHDIPSAAAVDFINMVRASTVSIQTVCAPEPETDLCHWLLWAFSIFVITHLYLTQILCPPPPGPVMNKAPTLSRERSRGDQGPMIPAPLALATGFPQLPFNQRLSLPPQGTRQIMSQQSCVCECLLQGASSLNFVPVLFHSTTAVPSPLSGAGTAAAVTHPDPSAVAFLSPAPRATVLSSPLHNPAALKSRVLLSQDSWVLVPVLPFTCWVITSRE